ncbi:hydantoinase/oxoprolinase family protein [Aestuariivirga litoralis]|uniref:Hydantoinase/oxoprolinase family protein n=1 Tax=Aestuariivirga litoralis TaxID=2650924 RepID=A0A2W2BQC0_9HYPH|nr:hydantoinase/oxoprolinase family protein [Aestuariivirga litoralis]PZF77917.1 hydantoinase/oxoprolinase family protein [Aestuariivirga litoralis]
MPKTAKLAADIGGTFTDIVLEDGAKRWSGKVLTTTDAPELGVIEGIGLVLEASGLKPQDIGVFIHGTTLATNALIERKGAKTAFITTEGFRDIIEQGYEKRFDHYDLMIDRPVPLVPRTLRFEITERLAADGRELLPLDEGAVKKLAQRIIAEDVKSVAIGFLHAYAHDRHEARVRELLTRLLPQDVTVCISSEVAPEIREYERFSTTVANAYVRPLMASYLYRLRDQLKAMKLSAPLFLMMSGGGLTTLETAARFPIRLVESGPAGGAILASQIAAECALPHVLSFDMGGTTAKICLLTDGEPERARKFEIARAYRDMKGSGIPVRIPVIEMVEIGAGGGSIARVDKLSRITVGPDSAGSTPGPVCYGRGGTEPAVTDANLALGKIDPAYFAGGKIALDEAAAKAALQKNIGAKLGLKDFWPAAGVTEIVEENMANAARVHAIERGHDIAACTMIAFGGGAPLHACRLAEKVGVDTIIVPKGAGVGSAIGFLRAPVAYEITKSAVVSLENFDAARVNRLLAAMTADARAVVQPALGKAKPTVQVIADCRYIGQGHEIRVPVPVRKLMPADGAKLKAAFEKLYEQVYGLRIPNQEAEAITWSVTVSSQAKKPKRAAKATKKAAPKPRSKRTIYDPALGRQVAAPVYWRFDMKPGAAIKGPAIIAEDETSTIVGANFTASVNSLGYIILERRR